MTRKEQLQHMEEKFEGDFWAAKEWVSTPDGEEDYLIVH